MPVLQLPDFEQTLAIAGGQLDAGELSECHGAACGLLCRHPASRADAFFSLLGSLELVKDPGRELASRLLVLYEATLAQLEDDQLRLALWLPADEDSLEDRTEALGHWCTGFLAGLGSGHDLSLDTLSDDVSEALADLQQIAQAQISGAGDSEEEEAALVEVIEYIRIVTLMMREELSPPKQQDRLY
jgi:uncharacterized protein YgfB (UPF0149 family)